MRNKNIEALRGIAMIGMLVYHYSVSIPGLQSDFPLLNIIKELVGQFSLISFFVLSGFGTFLWYEKRYIQDGSLKRGTLGYYIRRRLKKLYIPYCISIFTLLLITPRLNAVGNGDIKSLIFSLIFFHNFLPSGGINGVTWTIATILQLYLFSALFFYMIKRDGVTHTPFVFGLCVFLKYILTNYINVRAMDSMYMVLVGIRLPFTIFDLFFYGMGSAYLYTEYENVLGKISVTFRKIALFFIVLFFFVFMYFWSARVGIYGITMKACMSQSLMGMIISAIMLILATLPFDYKSFVGRGIQFVAKNEYGIFLWHMIILGNVIQYGGIAYAWMNEKIPGILMGILIFIAIIVGAIYNSLVNDLSECKGKRE